MLNIKKIGSDLRFQAWWIYRMLFRPCNLEIHLADHCNLNCAGCSHYSPLAEHAFCDIGQLMESLSKLSAYAKAFRTIRLLGGEPLLNPNVSDITKVIREYFPHNEVEVVTNGILLRNSHSGHIDESFWECCRINNIVIGVTVYPVGVDYDALKRMCKEKGIQFHIYGDRTVRSCFEVYALSPDRNGCILNYYRCHEMDFLQLVGSRIYSCPQCAYVGVLNKAFGYDFGHRKGDYLEVDDIDSRWSIRRFRLRAKPFCKYCIFPRRKVDWQLSKRSADEWVYKNVE